MRNVVIAIAAMLFSSPVFAEEINIGHLETDDDANALNWLFFHCNTSADQRQMVCEMIQTIMAKKSEAEVKESLKKWVGVDTLAEFNSQFGVACKSVDEMIAKSEQAIASGIMPDGKPANKRKLLSLLPIIKPAAEVCKSPTQDSTRQFFEGMTKRDLNTCTVHTVYFQSTFVLDAKTNTWTRLEGPVGPCGTIYVGTLTQEPQSHFWNYVERINRTNPDGVFPNGKSCKLFPSYTMNYTWKTTRTLEQCEFVESMPD